MAKNILSLWSCRLSSGARHSISPKNIYRANLRSRQAIFFSDNALFLAEATLFFFPLPDLSGPWSAYEWRKECTFADSRRVPCTALSSLSSSSPFLQHLPRPIGRHGPLQGRPIRFQLCEAAHHSFSLAFCLPPSLRLKFKVTKPRPTSSASRGPMGEARARPWLPTGRYLLGLEGPCEGQHCSQCGTSEVRGNLSGCFYLLFIEAIGVLMIRLVCLRQWIELHA